MNDELRSKTFNKNFSVKYEILCQVEKRSQKKQWHRKIDAHCKDD